MDEEERAMNLEILNAIPCAQLDYEEWLQVGMALQAKGHTLEDWQRWSATDPKRYDAKTCADKWEGFDADGGIGFGTVVELAKKYGWTQTKREVQTFGWDDVGYVVDTPKYASGGKPATITPQQQPTTMEPYGLCKWDTLPVPYELAPLPDNMGPADMLTAQLRAMFDMGECVNVVCEHEIIKDENGTEQHDGMRGETHPVVELHANAQDVLNRTNRVLGGYICVNPVSESRSNANVTAWRNVLVECDVMPRDEQLELIRRLGLPCACIVDSGNKSIHAVVRVDAKDAEEYKRRVAALYDYCEVNGLKPDHSCKNSSRLMRLAGAERAEYESMQRLIAVDHGGPKSWNEFLYAVKQAQAQQQPQAKADSGDTSNDLFTRLDAAVKSTADITGENRLPVPEFVVEGLVSVGSIVEIAAPSKNGKSWFVLNLAQCLCDGSKFLNRFKCRASRVLYVGAEIEEGWLSQRVDDVRTQMGGSNHYEYLNLRGENAFVTLGKLREWLVAKHASDYDVVIVDPLYLFEEGDENSADVMIPLMKEFKAIRDGLNCTLIFVHHFQKYWWNALPDQRPAGSGVMQRFVDEGIFLSPRFVPDSGEERTALDSYVRLSIDRSAYVSEFQTLSRNYDNPISTVVFAKPLFYVDMMEQFGRLPICGTREAATLKGGDSTRKKNEKMRNEKDEATTKAVRACKDHGEEATRANVHKRLEKVCESMGLAYPADTTFRDWTKKGGPTHWRVDTSRGNQLFAVDLEATDEDGNHTEPWLPLADDGE